jgi:hypothetical protein
MVMMLIFVEDSSELGAIWAFTPHLARAVVGIFILNGLPSTHNIIQTASFPADERVDIDKMFEYLTRAAKDALDHFSSATKMFLNGYFGLTFLCFVVDMFVFLVSFNRFGTHVESAYADTSLLISSISLFALDIYYIAWVVSLEKRVPPFVSNGVTKLAFGALDSMYASLGEKLTE